MARFSEVRRIQEARHTLTARQRDQLLRRMRVLEYLAPCEAAEKQPRDGRESSPP